MLTLDTTIPATIAKSVDEFNSYVDKYDTGHDLILTANNNISQATLRGLPASSIWKRNNCMEFHYIDGKEHLRFIYALAYEDDVLEDNRVQKAINFFSGILNVIPDDSIETYEPIFKCPENENSMYYNYCNDRYLDMTIDHCYSLDRNSSFLASMLSVYPATKPWVDKFYNEKLRLKALYGSKSVEYQNFNQYDKIIIGCLKGRFHRVNAWNKIISDSNRRVHELREYIESLGHIVLVVNTDAVKFIDRVSYDESPELGDFKYEWQDTKMYIKSVKSYAYMDNDKWKFKQAGQCKLDLIKPREEWTLEDFKSKETQQVLHIKIQNRRLVEYYA